MNTQNKQPSAGEANLLSVQTFDYTSLSDEALVPHILKHQNVFSHIIHRYEAPLGRYIRRKAAVRPQDIEDILQEVFIKVYTNLHGFDQALKFSSWIYRITHNTVISWYRKQKVRPQHGLLEEDENNAFGNIVSELQTDARVFKKEAAEAVQKGIKDLPEKYYEIIVLRYLEHKSYEEISDILQIPTNTVATRIRRALKRLQSIIPAEYAQV